MAETVLVGDIGGTNTRFGVAHVENGVVKIDGFFKTPNDAHTNFKSALRLFLDQSDTRPEHACFAIAGPVSNNAVKLTNRDWSIIGQDLKTDFDLESVCLINDFAAMARAVPELESGQFIDLIPGQSVPDAPIIVTGPGTGFGVATLMQTPIGKWQVLQGEGGHMAYAPQTELEYQVSQILVRDHGYASNELVASGSGLPAVHRAFCEIYKTPYQEISPANMLELAANGNEMFVALCNLRARTVLRAAGDLVLANGACGGVVLAGGVTERLMPYLQAADTLPSFSERGPLSHYLKACPVRLMTDPAAPLIGAAATYHSNF